MYKKSVAKQRKKHVAATLLGWAVALLQRPAAVTSHCEREIATACSDFIFEPNRVLPVYKRTNPAQVKAG